LFLRSNPIRTRGCAVISDLDSHVRPWRLIAASEASGNIGFRDAARRVAMPLAQAPGPAVRRAHMAAKLICPGRSSA